MTNNKKQNTDKKEEGTCEDCSLQFKNYPVTSGDRDNNEPSIAINPADHNNMVAGSNDYNTPDNDAWPGFYTTHNGGVTWKEDLIPGDPGDSRSSELSGYKGGGDPERVCANDGTGY